MNNKSLQKLTHSEIISSTGNQLIRELYRVKEDITEEDAKALLKRMVYFGKEILDETPGLGRAMENDVALKALYNGLNDEILEAWERTPETFRKMLRIDMPAMRHQRWERNHQFILSEISNITLENGSAPDLRILAERTGLSRQTIAKHLTGFKKSEYYQEHLNRYKMLEKRVLDKLYRLTMNEGDVRAAKIFLDYLKTSEPAKVTNNNFNIPGLP
jgi:hypothetical protein